MSDSFQPLPQLEIATPCPKSWDEMSGDAQSRFCSHCEKSVFNFSEMTSSEVQAAMKSNESVCARMRRRKDGSIVTRDCVADSNDVTRRDWFSKVYSSAAALALLTLVGCGKSRNTEPDVVGIVAEPPEEIMGDVVDCSEMGEVCETIETPAEREGDQDRDIVGKVRLKPKTAPE